MTQLMVIEGHQLVPTADESQQDVEVEYEQNEFDAESLEALSEEIALLEQTVADDRDRIRDFLRKIESEVQDENEEIMELGRAIEAEYQILKKSDDIEDQERAKQMEESLDEYDIEPEEEDDAPSRSANVENEEEMDDPSDFWQQARQKQLKLLKHLFKLITIKTHPDKCGNTSKLNLYRAACRERDNLNLHGMEAIYKEVYGHAYGKSSLYDRLLEARRRREQLRQELSDIRSTGAWTLYQVNLEHDFKRAASVLRENLKLQIQGMRTMLSELQNQRNWM